MQVFAFYTRIVIMKRSYTLACILSIFLLALLCACTRGDKNIEILTPSPALSETETPVSSDSTLSGSPVKRLYTQYALETALALKRFYAYLSATNDLDALETTLLLSEHSAYLNKGKVSAGRLSEDGSSTPLIGAARGLGAIEYPDETDQSYCEFYFNYDDGRVMEGICDANTLYLEVNYVETLESNELDDGIQRDEAEAGLLGPLGLAGPKAETLYEWIYSVYIERNELGWFSCVDIDSRRLALFITAEDARLLCLELAEGEAFPAYSYEATAALATWIYSLSGGLEKA